MGLAMPCNAIVTFLPMHIFLLCDLGIITKNRLNSYNLHTVTHCVATELCGLIYVG